MIEVAARSKNLRRGGKIIAPRDVGYRVVGAVHIVVVKRSGHIVVTLREKRRCGKREPADRQGRHKDGGQHFGRNEKYRIELKRSGNGREWTVLAQELSSGYEWFQQSLYTSLKRARWGYLAVRHAATVSDGHSG